MDAAFMGALGKIIMINLVLSGDNAVVIAMACRNLSPNAQKKGIFWGTLGAVVFRVILTFFAAWLLQFAYLQIIAGSLLLYIAVDLLVEDHKEEEMEATDDLMGAIKTILFADVIMSLDNVLGIAAVAQGNLVLLVVGLAISIPIVVFGSTLILRVMDRYPIIIYAGAAILGYVAGEMLVGDQAVAGIMAANPWLHSGIPIAMAVLVVVLGHFRNKKQQEKANAKKLESESSRPSLSE